MAIAELRDAHGAPLTALLGVLRDRTLDDANARTRAVDLTVPALTELRSARRHIGQPHSRNRY
ncbi:hypothetical protein ACF1G5_24290 [Streptomyces coeruleorubidus]|uniref:hypothetical protein n=1 Tax=Streptomyces coeruleorubidus TaxID=116188 RepID=UPI0036FCF3F7